MTADSPATWDIEEQLNVQFRTEIFNALNHANFGHPNLILFSGSDISPTAGTITSTLAGGNGRQIQFALRLEFSWKWEDQVESR